MQDLALSLTSKHKRSRRAPSLAEIISLAVQPEIDAEKLSHIVKARELDADRKAKLAFARGMNALACELPEVRENGEIAIAGQVVASYALWEDIDFVIRPRLAKRGFSLSFRTLLLETEGAAGDASQGVEIVALLQHTLGHSEKCSLRLPSDRTGDKNNIQALGSAISYGKRYTACALLNITTRGADDDGQSACAAITPEQLAELEARLPVAETRERFLAYMRASSLSTIPAQRYDEALSLLNEKASFARAVS